MASENLVIAVDFDGTDLISGNAIGIGTVERTRNGSRLKKINSTLEDAAVLFKDPDQFEEFKETREKDIVEEDKLKTELPRIKRNLVLLLQE